MALLRSAGSTPGPSARGSAGDANRALELSGRGPPVPVGPARPSWGWLGELGRTKGQSPSRSKHGRSVCARCSLGSDVEGRASSAHAFARP